MAEETGIWTARAAIRSRLWFRRWWRRGLFVAGGVAVGAAAVLMALLADQAQAAFRLLQSHAPGLAFVATPIGFAVAVYVARRFFPNSQGSGIPQTIAALRIDVQAERTPLVSMRVAIGKVLVMTFGLLCGASAGREGPTVQVGAAIMFALGAWSPHRQAGFLLAGAAAGVAAAFNTPLAGIVFGIEEMSRSFETRTSGLVLGAVIAAGLTAIALTGDYTYFGSTAASVPLGRGWIAILVCSAVGGAAGGLFIRGVTWVGSGLPPALGRVIKAHPIAFAAACGLVVALCGLDGNASIFGTGYEQARAVVDGQAPANLWFAPLKFLATAASAVSGIPGGIFSPSLSIGAGIASALSPAFGDVPLAALALIGMVSYLTGVVRAPITSFIIVAEMTNDHAMVIPLMAAALIADRTSALLSHEGYYQVLAEAFLRPRAAV